MPVSDVLAQARVLLNDATGKLYTEPELIPYYNLAQNELQSELELMGAQFLKDTAARITVPAGTTVLAAPADLVEPITLFEGSEGAQVENFIEMEELQFLPLLPQEVELRYWVFQDEGIEFLGSTANRDVIVRYRKGLTPAVAGADLIEYPKGANFLAYETAALTAAYAGENPTRSAKLDGKAAYNLSLVKRKIARDQQSLPVRRKPFFRRRTPYLHWRG